MNSNRTKYASTPTYGMQKRNFNKKQAAAQDAPTPDFSQQPILDMNAGGAAFSAQNPFGIPQGAIPGVAQSSASAMFAAGQNAQPAPQMPQGYGGMQMPFPAGQPFMNGGTPMNGQNGFGAMNTMPPAFGMNQYPGAQPAMGVPGYQTFPQGMQAMPGSTLNPSMQGYMLPAYPQGGAIPPSVTRSEPMNGQGGMAAGMPMPGMPGVYGGIGLNGMPQGGASPSYQTASYPPVMNMGGNGGGFGRPPFGTPSGGPPASPTPRMPFDLDKWIKLFLFLILPLLFISAIFASYLRYPFIIASIIALSVVWYRQSFTSATRTAITVGYLLLTIVIIAMLIGPGSDSTQTGNLDSRNAAQASAEPTVSPEAEPLAAQETPQSAEAVGESEAEQRLATFMSYWQQNRIEDMVNLVQPSWATVQDNAASALFTVISNRTPQDYAIEGISGTSADNSRTVTMSAYIDKNNGKEPVRYRFMILMVKESGEWFVDPNSLATNDVATETPSPAPGKETVVQSLQPRMTVTPIPDPNTKLYYNANGGKYYHADPNCSAVNPKFLPMASFLYKELDDAPYNSLQPCLKCGAPTQSLGKLAEQATATPTLAP